METRCKLTQNINKNYNVKITSHFWVKNMIDRQIDRYIINVLIVNKQKFAFKISASVFYCTDKKEEIFYFFSRYWN